MKATELIEKQHRVVEDLFKRFEEGDPEEKADVFEEIAMNLVAHDAIEREILYPACEKALGKEEDILGESLVEHGVVEFCVFRADKHKDSDDFDKYVKVLEEMVAHHVEEEEEELLPKMKKALETEELEVLGKLMEARFKLALESDFREPLRNNLEQVLAGATKTVKRASGSAPKQPSATAGKNGKKPAGAGRAHT